jgi:hypothetical protein
MRRCDGNIEIGRRERMRPKQKQAKTIDESESCETVVRPASVSISLSVSEWTNVAATSASVLFLKPIPYSSTDSRNPHTV